MEERISASIEHWKRKLLDLSKRNLALNFRMSKVSTVEIVDEVPAQVFRQLVLREGAMRFKPILPEPPVARNGRSPQGASGTLQLAGDSPSDSGDVYDGVEIPVLVEEELDPNRHQDDRLQAKASPSGLDRSLRRLAEKALTIVEEQGVNALYLTLGMLHYPDMLEPDRKLQAPIVLVPVMLSRRAAGAGFTLRLADDDPIVNPALAEYLRRSYGLSLPVLPEPAAMEETYNIQEVLDEVDRLLTDRKDWSVGTDLFLALFSFQKLVMYRDLDANAARFMGHRIIRQIVTRSGQGTAYLPDDVRALDLDEAFAPEATTQVVDADSSQLRAIAAVSRGHDLVLEGPPGTGKSQTITNLIGQALADGKTVLFVAEKMAALNVVHRRLEDTGLGAFCLELHSTKTNKRDVLHSVKTALEASVLAPAFSTAASERLPGLRAALNEYAEAVHTPHGVLGLSPFAAYGELGAVLNAPKVRLTQSIRNVSRLQITETVEALHLLHQEVKAIGDPNTHPWRDTTQKYYAASDRDDVEGLLADLKSVIDRLQPLAAEVEQAFGHPPVRTMEDIRTAIVVADMMEKSPGAPAAVLRSEAWNAPPPEACLQVVHGRRLVALRSYVEARLSLAALERDHAVDVAFIEEKESGRFRWLNLMNSRYRLIKKRWIALRLPGYAPSMTEQAVDMKKVDDLRREREAMAQAEQDGCDLFGALWAGEASDWDALDSYVRWVVDFRAACVRHGLKEQAASVASRAQPDVSLIRKLESTGGRVMELLARLREGVRWPEDYLSNASFEEIAGRVRTMSATLDQALRWAAYEVARTRVAAGPAAELLPQALAGEVAFDDLPGAFKRAYYQRWLDELMHERPLLRDFHTLEHEQRVTEFQKLDQRVLLDNRQALVGRLRDQTQALLLKPEAAAGIGFLRSQINRQRGHAPLRRTLREAGATIRAIKPCFLMSPLTVAQLLDDAVPPFDLVVFDEASQLTGEDAVGAIVRGKNLVVVGDPKQLPPTNFFAVMAGQVVAETDENGDPIVEETESILEECLSAGLPTTRLRWHYRSREESLIMFSNASFYDADLYTFPSVYINAHARGLAFEYVPDGVYEGKGLNHVEARRVAEAVVQHAKKHPESTLGVGTFNLRQQIAILDELEDRRRQDPSLEPFFSSGKDEPFFVKNLENIQGDERDVIFLSVTYAKNRDGMLRHNFGPINGENGWRRLNVITTRARQHMRVFSSMHGDEIDLTKTNATGARLLREFLLYAERGHLDSVFVSGAVETESAFEADVFRELSMCGLRLQPQVGVAGYRIDFGVLDDEMTGRFVCGIECDGATYHSSSTARDRDRLRQQVLNSRGWTIHRIWSTDWFKDRRGQIERILSLVAQSRAGAKEEAHVVAAEEETDRVESALPSVGDASAEHPKGERSPASLEAAPYRFADLSFLQTGLFSIAFHEMPLCDLLPPIRAVVEAEAPLHINDLATRLANSYGFSRVGSRIAEHVDRACEDAADRGILRRRGDFIWGSSDETYFRTRAGTGIPAERIAPEEYCAAVVSVLGTRVVLERKALVNEVRALFGFNRTGSQLEQAIQTSTEALLHAGIIGEGGTGLVLRRGALV